ncbi:hypothetical protein CR51_37320 [Caballeronia megalochromosomata]|nr:hypothetical protein CR51_37320 [Caballeronia megalochromosomata]
MSTTLQIALRIKAFLPLLACSFCVAFAQPLAQFSAANSSIDPGQATTLSWTSSGERAFISGIGLVPPAGHVIVQPKETTRYFILVERDQVLTSSETTVEVEHVRAGTFAPDFSNFKPQLSRTVKSKDFLQFLNSIYTILLAHDYQVRTELDKPANFKTVTFYTEYAEDNDVLRTATASGDESDRGIRHRQLAIYVRVHKPDSSDDPIIFDVAINVQHLRRSESEWVDDTDNKLRTDIVHMVANILSKN